MNRSSLFAFSLPLAYGALAITSLLVSGCGGSSTSGTPHFTQIVSFGDSLSDVGTYRVGTVAAVGGGEFTINGPSNEIWVQDLASVLNLPAPCAAETGLDGSAAAGFSVPVTTHAGCYGYAQGGARVTNPVGPGNAALGGSNAILGLLTVPVSTQIQNYLAANNGNFTGKELVTIWAGANDVFIQAGTVAAGAETPTQAVTAMAQAATELAGYINTGILGNGANYVLVLDLPDITLTPYALALPSADLPLIAQLVTTFNQTLQAGVAASPNTRILWVDAFTLSQTEAANATTYGLTNITTPACNLSLQANPLGSSLICSVANLSGSNVLNYEYADTVHPTPYAHALLAKGILMQMSTAGWY